MKRVSFSELQLSVLDSPPPALTSVRSRNAAQPQTRLLNLLLEGHRLPVQSLQSEGFTGDLSDRREIVHEEPQHWLKCVQATSQSHNLVCSFSDQIVSDSHPKSWQFLGDFITIKFFYGCLSSVSVSQQTSFSYGERHVYFFKSWYAYSWYSGIVLVDCNQVSLLEYGT